MYSVAVDSSVVLCILGQCGLVLIVVCVLSVLMYSALQSRHFRKQEGGEKFSRGNYAEAVSVLNLSLLATQQSYIPIPAAASDLQHGSLSLILANDV